MVLHFFPFKNHNPYWVEILDYMSLCPQSEIVCLLWIPIHGLHLFERKHKLPVLHREKNIQKYTKWKSVFKNELNSFTEHAELKRLNGSTWSDR